MNDYGSINQSENNGILVGPMFSHLIANLVLKDIDREISENMPAKYFRYVDDIMLVGDHDAVNESLTEIQSRLQKIGLELHDESSQKSYVLSTSEWLEGRDDYSETSQLHSWMTLIANLKRFLLLNPEARMRVQESFQAEEMRIPVGDYSAASRERHFLTRLRELATLHWFRRKGTAVSVESLTEEARWIRDTFRNEVRVLLESADSRTGFARRRLIPQIRYRLGRLIYLAPSSELLELADHVASFPELCLYAEVMKAVATGNLDRVLSFGTNAAQAAAQPLRAAGLPCVVTSVPVTEVEVRSLAVCYLNGLAIDCPPIPDTLRSELLQFSVAGPDERLIRSSDPFVRELACLHGPGEGVRHPEMLESIFDSDEELAFDAIDQMHQPTSF